jgi:dephospho-CoA kinase
VSIPPDLPASDPEPVPTLTAEIVADDETLAEAVDEVVRRDPVAREQLAEITTYQEMLQAAVDADTWRLVLHIEELTTARFADALLIVAVWAFTEGVRNADPPRGAS